MKSLILFLNLYFQFRYLFSSIYEFLFLFCCILCVFIYFLFNLCNFISDFLLSQLLSVSPPRTIPNHSQVVTLQVPPNKNKYNSRISKLLSAEKHLSCDICGKWCISKSSLLTHMRVHTGEKPFGCDICDKKFAQKATLQRHRQLHTGEKHLKCDHCTKRFYRKDKLYEHLHTHNKL